MCKETSSLAFGINAAAQALRMQAGDGATGLDPCSVFHAREVTGRRDSDRAGARLRHENVCEDV